MKWKIDKKKKARNKQDNIQTYKCPRQIIFNCHAKNIRDKYVALSKYTNWHNYFIEHKKKKKTKKRNHIYHDRKIDLNNNKKRF